MLINIKYDIGQKIKWNSKQETTKFETCSFCNGSKKVQGQDRSILNCPKCFGSGSLRVYNTIEREGTISGYRVDYDTNNLIDYPDGARILYYTELGAVNQNSIIARLS